MAIERSLFLPWTDVRHGSQLSLSFFLLLHPAPPPEQQSTFWIFFPDIFLHAPVFLLIFLKQNPSPAPLASTIIEHTVSEHSSTFTSDMSLNAQETSQVLVLQRSCKGSAKCELIWMVYWGDFAITYASFSVRQIKYEKINGLLKV